MTDAQETAWNSRILLGLAIVVIGLAMLVETNEDWGIHIHVGWWPFLLIFLGVYPKPVTDIVNPAVKQTLSDVHKKDPQPEVEAAK